MATNTILVQEEPRGPSQLVEIIVGKAGLQRIAFPDVQQLRSTAEENIIIKAMRIIPAGAQVGGPTAEGPTAPLTELQKMWLVIYSEGWEKAQYIPVTKLIDIITANTPYSFHTTRFDNWRKVDFTKSFIQFANGTSSVLPEGEDAYVILLEVEYVRVDQYNNEINTPS